MLFSEDDAPHLKKWIVKRLENTSDADADVLADYVLALLRHDGDEGLVRELCEQEIPDFLKEDSTLFVQDVFETIQYKSYLPGAAPPPKQGAPSFLPPSGPAAMSYPGMMSDLNGAQNGSRKRSFHEQAGSEGGDANYQYGANGIRNYKQPRRELNPARGGRFGTYDNNRPGLPQRAPGYPNMMQPPLQSPLGGMPVLDSLDPMAAVALLAQAQQAMGLPFSGMPPNTFPHPSSAGQGAGFRSTSITRPYGQKSRCRDYDLQGFCARGNTCQFEHGSESIFLPPADEYDPSNSSLIPTFQAPLANGTGAQPYNSFGGTNRGHDGGRGRGGSQRGDRGGQRGNAARRGGRAEFSSDRPNYDRSNTTIVVENIPEEKFSEKAVRGFFEAFGTITEVTMRPYKRLAIVKYNDWNSAKDAYNSPQVIFDNRFVKVYWYTSADKLPQPPAVAGTNGSGAKNGSSTPAPARSTSEAPVNIEEFAMKQQEAQKAQEEKAKKRAETEAALQDMKLKQEALLKKFANEQKRLNDKLAAKGGKAVTSNEGSASSNGGRKSEIEILKEKLAKKKAEAESLTAVDESESYSTTDEYAWRGRGRGRGAYRGRGPYVPRGGSFRGGFRGRGAAFAAGKQVYNLDNRPKKLYLTGVDFTDPEKNESLREHLLGYEHTEIETGFEKSFVTFVDRKTAERWLTACPGGEIPSVGKVEIGWVPNGPLPPVKSSVHSANAEKKATGGGGGEDTNMIEDGDAMARDDRISPVGGRGGVGDQHQQQAEMDYDVADDNDWVE